MRFSSIVSVICIAFLFGCAGHNRGIAMHGDSSSFNSISSFNSRILWKQIPEMVHASQPFSLYLSVRDSTGVLPPSIAAGRFYAKIVGQVDDGATQSPALWLSTWNQRGGYHEINGVAPVSGHWTLSVEYYAGEQIALSARLPMTVMGPMAGKDHSSPGAGHAGMNQGGGGCH